MLEHVRFFITSPVADSKVLVEYVRTVRSLCGTVFIYVYVK